MVIKIEMKIVKSSHSITIASKNKIICKKQDDKTK